MARTAYACDNAQAMSAAGALDELRACSGTQFDPMVVAAFVRVLRARASRALRSDAAA